MNATQAWASASRSVRRNPLSATGIVVALTLGIGISVSMFSVLYGVVLGSLPYPDGDRIAVIYTDNQQQGVSRGGLTPAEAIEGLIDVPGFEHTAYTMTEVGIFTGFDGMEPPRVLPTMRVSQDYFSVFGSPAILGRTLIQSDFAEQRPVAVLNYAAWLELTGGDPTAIGRTLSFQDGRQFELVGVLPESFGHPSRDLWMFRPWSDADVPPGAHLTARIVNAVGRIEEAGGGSLSPDDGLQVRWNAVYETHGLPDHGWRIGRSALIDDIVGNVRGILYTLFGVGLLVLLVACSTAASLMSVRIRQRDTELALRQALGASRAQVATAVLVELLFLVIVAGLGGVLLAYFIVEAMQPLAAGYLPRADRIEIGGATLLFAIGAAAASLLLSTVAPLLNALRLDSSGGRLGSGPNHEIEGGRRVAVLPAAGVGLSTVALVTALALSASLIRLSSVDPGFRTDRVAALQFTVQTAAPQDDVPLFLDRVFEELRAVPGVVDVAAVAPWGSVFTPGTALQVTAPEMDARRPMTVYTRPASGGYHALLDIQLLRGRDISDRDDVFGAPPVAVINETLARRAFGSGNPIGRTLLVTMGVNQLHHEVVGVVADIRNSGLRAPPEPSMFLSIRQMPWNVITLLVDSEIVPLNWMQTLREAIWRIDPDQAIVETFTLEEKLEEQTRSARFFAMATGWFAVLAVILGAVGINSVVASMQQRRVREIGLRLALGATPGSVAGLVLRSTARILLTGLAIGALLAIPTFRWLTERGQLFDTSQVALWGLLGLTAIVLAAAALAAVGWLAWKCSRVAPMEALRCE